LVNLDRLFHISENFLGNDLRARSIGKAIALSVLLLQLLPTGEEGFSPPVEILIPSLPQ
jgi:hypothetical protein